ncbi:MAG: protein adenylyltransferase SelO family protein, partial [Sedimentibacter sp.]
NLSRLAETLVPLFNENKEHAIKLAQDAVTEFYELYHNHWIAGMRSKLGIFNEEADDEKLIEQLLNLMQKNNEDYTNTFIKLTFNDTFVNETAEFKEWHNKWQARLQRQAQTKEESFELMQNSNPAVIPRNHRVEEALRAADEKEDYSVMEHLISILNKPFAHTADQKEYAELPPPSLCKYKTYCGT